MQSVYMWGFCSIEPCSPEEGSPMPGAKVVSRLDANSGFWQRKAGTAAVNLSIQFTQINNIIFKGHPYVISENIQAALMKNSKFETKLLHSHSSHVNNLLQIHLSLLNLTG